MPERIQRRRTKGWRMPEGAVYVGRPSRFGNPFTVEEHGLPLSIELYRNAISGMWSPFPLKHLTDVDYQRNYKAMLTLRARIGKGHPAEMVRTELRGRDLACWCPLDQPCHADVLLELAAR